MPGVESQGEAMSFLFFLDESGHDHKNMPYEVRGGVVLHSSVLWSFVRDMMALEVDAFGDRLHVYGTEIKGHKLLDRDRFRWSDQAGELDPMTRRANSTAFLRKSVSGGAPTRIEFTAYGQASLMMARGIFDLLEKHGGRVFACAIPRGAHKGIVPPADYLRKDQVFLLERFYYFLEESKQTGLLVMDETEKKTDRQFVARLQRYFTLTHTGQLRSKWIVPSPFFVSSDMAYPVQAADVCIYCINCGFRIADRGMDAEVRPEIATEFAQRLSRLQWQCERGPDVERFVSYSIVYVPDPYTARQ